MGQDGAIAVNADKMIDGYKQGQIDCRDGFCNYDNYHSDNVYAIGYSTGWDSIERQGLKGVDNPKPKLFVVVEIDQNYEYIDGVNFVDMFSTEEEAAYFISNDHTSWTNSVREYNEYLNNFVESIDIPQPEEGEKWVKHDKWLEFIEPFKLDKYLTNSNNFHYKLKEHLRNYFKSGWKEIGFNPPKLLTGRSLYIVEIPETAN